MEEVNVPISVMCWKKCVTHENKTAVFVWLLRAQSLGVSFEDNTNTIKDANIMQEIYLYSYNAPVGNMKVESPIFEVSKQ